MQFCGVSKRGLFGDVVAELDWLVGQVLGSVDATGERNNTIIFFSSCARARLCGSGARASVRRGGLRAAGAARRWRGGGRSDNGPWTIQGLRGGASRGRVCH